MAEQNTTNIRIILDKILRHPLMQDLSLETAVDYAVDFMRIVGTPRMFTEKIANITLEDYRAELPEDYYQMIQVRGKEGSIYNYATDSFHLSNTCNTNKTYKVQGHVIFTSSKEDDLEISYMAIDTDSDGFPLIPDNSSFTRALELYIKKQWFTILFDLGKISNASFQHVLQEYAWAVGDCQTEFNRMSLDQAEAFYNSWRTLILRDNQHKAGFINNGSK